MRKKLCRVYVSEALRWKIKKNAAMKGLTMEKLLENILEEHDEDSREKRFKGLF